MAVSDGVRRGLGILSAAILIGVFAQHGCASHATTRPTTTTAPSTKPSTKPTYDTISIELKTDQGPFAPRARGVLRPTPSVQIPPALLLPLGEVAKGKDGGPPPTLITLGDVVKFDGAFPGEKGNWTKWDAGVEALIRAQQSQGAPVIYEIWKEPNEKPFTDRLNFFSAWVHTVRNIRRMAPTAVLMGPGISKHDAGWNQEFLKVSKEYGVLPDIVSWHEDGLKHDISGHVGGMTENFWQDGTNVPRIVIGPNAAIENREEAGDPAIFLAQMEKSARDQAWRPVTQQFQFKLTHLFTNELRPHSNYYTYRQYVALAANGGRCVKLNGSDTVEGLAVWNAPARTVKALVGRNRSRVDANRVLGAVTLQIRGAAGATLHVRGTRIANSGGKPAEAPEVSFEKDFPLKDDRADIPLPNFASGDAYSLEIIVRGSPATAATKPTSQKSPTTRPTSAPSTNKSASPK